MKSVIGLKGYKQNQAVICSLLRPCSLNPFPRRLHPPLSSSFSVHFVGNHSWKQADKVCDHQHQLPQRRNPVGLCKMPSI